VVFDEIVSGTAKRLGLLVLENDDGRGADELLRLALLELQTRATATKRHDIPAARSSHIIPL
jgi:hypothetical protein